MSRFQAAVLVLLGLIACAVFALVGVAGLLLMGQAPASGGQAAASPPTPAPVAVETVEPTHTQVAPTPTTLPPTATLLPSTSTPLPPTATSTQVVADTPTATAPSPAQPVAPPPMPPEQNLEMAQVINVVDGDTIDVLLNGVEYRVRYILVDTPETKHPTKGVQPFGPEASEANRQMVSGQTVYLEKDVSNTDRYDRLLRYVYLPDGRLVNEELLRLGLAQVATFPPDVKYVDRFRAVQGEAQAAGVGLWGAAPDVSPPENTVIGSGNSVAIVDLNKRAEYVDLHNGGAAAVDLSGWRLLSEKGDQNCTLGGVIGPGETLRVWALASDAAQGGYSCGFTENIWNNSDPDAAVLFDAGGAVVSRME